MQLGFKSKGGVLPKHPLVDVIVVAEGGRKAHHQLLGTRPDAAGNSLGGLRVQQESSTVALEYENPVLISSQHTGGLIG